MKKASATLYDLIAQLNKSEKRYFKLYSERHQIGKQNQYHQLYELIEEKNLNSDELVKKEIQKFPFANYYPIAKKNLLDNLLNALSQFHQASSIDEEIKQLCHKASILFDKSLIPACRTYLKKAKKKALSFERFHLMLEILFLEKKVLSQQYDKQSSFENLQKIYEEENHYLNIIKNKNDYWFLFTQIYKFHFQKIRSRKQSDQDQFERWINDPLLQDINLAKSISAQLDFYQLNALKAFVKNQHEEALMYNNHFLALFDKHQNLIFTQPERYMSTLNNYLIDCLQLKKKVELQAGLKRLRETPKHKAFKGLKQTPINVFRLGNLLEFNGNISEGDFQKNCTLIPNVADDLIKYKPFMVAHNEVTFYYLFAYSYFGANSFEKALDWSNKIINETKENIVAELQGTTRLLNLLAHYELGNEELLQYTIINTKRYFTRRKQLYEVEKEMLSGLNKLIGLPKKERPQLFDKLYKTLSELKANPKESRSFNNFDYLAWVIGKQKGISFKEAFDSLIA